MVKKKVVKIILLSIIVLIIIFVSTFIPTLWLKTRGMKSFEGEYVTVYYEKEEAAARDVFELVDSESERIANALSFEEPQNIKMYIYDNQSTFQTKKYGLIVVLLNLDWYVGDNRGTNVLLTSPAASLKMHDYDKIIQVSIHEMVHAYNSILNPKMPLWVNEGLAGYLSNQNPKDDGFSVWYVPSIEEMQTSNPVTFSQMNGYPLSYAYIEYLNNTFSWDSVLTFARTNNFTTAFGIDESVFYDDWIYFLIDNYSE